MEGGFGWFGGHEWWVGVWFGLVWLPRVVGLDGLDGLVGMSGGWVPLPLPR